MTGLDNVVAIAAGNSAGHGVSGAVRRDGTVWMWGAGTSGMMGNGGEQPAAPDAPGGRTCHCRWKASPARKTSRSEEETLRRCLATARFRMWGHNGYGESGIGSANAYEPRPVKTALTDVAAVYLGNLRSYAVRTDGTL